MIDFVEGKIDLGERCIFLASPPDVWRSLAARGVVEKRTAPAGGEDRFYVEVVTDGMRFGVHISPGDEKIGCLALYWLDGPCTSKGWDGVSEEALRQEYCLLLNFLQKAGGRPDDKGEPQRTWRFKWGWVDVCYQPRNFVAAIFIRPRRARQFVPALATSIQAD